MENLEQLRLFLAVVKGGSFSAAARELDLAPSSVSRQITDLETGRYSFETIKPGSTDRMDGQQQAPHVVFWIVARGINLGLSTRMYFPDETEANANCHVLAKVDAQRRDTLVAQHDDRTYVFDIHLQGDRETVFFDV